MKKGAIGGLCVVMALLSGCAANTELLARSSVSTHNDVFEELWAGGPVPRGHADLHIALSMKTHKPGIHSAEDTHGTQDYRLLLNIDGQAVRLRGTLCEENIEPRGLRDPEAGDGIRYRFRKSLRLETGAHKIIVAIPDDGIAVEREITLVEGGVNNLVLEPVYGTDNARQRPGFYGVTSFTQGLKGLRVVFNGNSI